MTKKLIGLIMGPLLFSLILLLFHPEGLSTESNAVLAVTTWVAIWWITEAISIEATALLPIILFPLTGGLGLTETGAAYGHKYIFLFIGGFILAIAIEKWNLHKRIALSIINIMGITVNRVILGFMVSTAFLSMWISNTATAIMMLPIALAVILQFNERTELKDSIKTQFGKAIMLSIAYSASIGGMATLIGTPPNVIFAGVVQENFGVEITFAQWILIGLPISMILLVICWQYLTKFAFKLEGIELPGGKDSIKAQLSSLGKMSFEEKSVLVVFVCTALAWIFKTALPGKLSQIDDAVIAMIAGLSFFILPAKNKNERLLKWKEAVNLPWGVLMLFGGGIALAAGFQSSGLAIWIGDQFTALEGISIFILVLLLIAIVNFLTEITSNLATTSVLLPVLIPLALVVDVHPYILMAACAVAASCAFMLPVATPPNAIVFGSGYLKISDMIRTGVWLNLISIVVLTLIIYFLLPILWGIDLSPFPASLK
jgi:sodium-dependent dicarboxylate transporter 2/3/5